MNQPFAKPSAIIDCARVIAYACVNADVCFTGRCGMHVDGRPLGQVEKFAICRNLADGDILLLYCDSEWNSLAAGGHATVEEAKFTAERGYAGIESMWRDLLVEESEVTDYLDLHWPPCSFCGKRGFQVSSMVGEAPRICSECIERFHSIMQSRNS